MRRPAVARWFPRFAGLSCLPIAMNPKNEFKIARLHHAIMHDLSIAYPILVEHGYMERTPNGYVAIDPEAVLRRARCLIEVLKADMPAGNASECRMNWARM